MTPADEQDHKLAAWNVLSLRSDVPEAEQLYEHYKGGIYSIVAVAIREDTLVPVVIYRSHLYGTVWERTLENFQEYVRLGDVTVSRFKRVPL